MTLDDKLMDILAQHRMNSGELDKESLEQQCVELIKQAFADEGYIPPKAKMFWHQKGKNVYISGAQDHIVSVDMEQLMTGQEWYGRFEAELKAHPMVEGQYDVFQVARRAAGLDKEKK